MPNTITISVIDKEDQTPRDFVVDRVGKTLFDSIEYYKWLFETFGYRFVHYFEN